MATATPVLERERREERDLKAYGKLTGREDSAVMTEEQKAIRFNSRIADNYQRLINPEYHKAEEIAPELRAAEEETFAPARPVFDAAPAFEPVRQPEQTAYGYGERLTVNSPVFGAEARTAEYAAPQEAPVQEFVQTPDFASYDYEQAPAYTEEEADLMPTSTTIQYKSDLFEEEKPVEVEEKKGYALTAKGKLLMAVYAVVVVVILALIIINTSVLKTLDADIADQQEALNAVISQSQQLRDEADYLSSDGYVIEWAENNGYVHR